MWPWDKGLVKAGLSLGQQPHAHTRKFTYRYIHTRIYTYIHVYTTHICERSHTHSHTQRRGELQASVWIVVFPNLFPWWIVHMLYSRFVIIWITAETQREREREREERERERHTERERERDTHTQRERGRETERERESGYNIVFGKSISRRPPLHKVAYRRNIDVGV